jgi:hypothetical protein
MMVDAAKLIFDLSIPTEVYGHQVMSLPTLKTTRFLLFVEAKPCDNRVTEKASTFSRASPYVLAPRPGLEPGTYGLTASAAVN